MLIYCDLNAMLSDVSFGDNIESLSSIHINKGIDS